MQQRLQVRQCNARSARQRWAFIQNADFDGDGGASAFVQASNLVCDLGLLTCPW